MIIKVLASLVIAVIAYLIAVVTVASIPELFATLVFLLVLIYLEISNEK